MKNDRETKLRLLTSAKSEFMEKGYMQASLRSICKNAGVTTGALYFFFEDKEDIFAACVEEPLNKLYEVMNHHYREEMTKDFVSIISLEQNFSDDLNAANQIIHYLYQYRDVFLMIMTKGQGSRFEKSIDQFVDITEKHYRRLADKITQQNGSERIDDYMIHWIAHMNIDFFVHMITHEASEDAAKNHMKSIVKYLTMGWNGLFQ